MLKRLRESSSKGNIPSPRRGETGDGESSRDDEPSRKDSLLTPRSAGILGASLVIAMCAGGLTYLGTRGTITSPAWAVLSGGTAFAGAVRLLNSIIA